MKDRFVNHEDVALYGCLIHAWRNENKMSHDILSECAEIPAERLRALERGDARPSWDELERLAQALCVSVRDLVPLDNDMGRGLKALRARDARRIDQQRAGRHQVTYLHRVMSSALPSIRTMEILLHGDRREELVMNRGHFFHQLAVVLSGGPVAVMWKWRGEMYEEVYEEGDSWLLPGFVPHVFYSADPKNHGRVLAVTFGQHLTGDARQELTLIGKENAARIIAEDDDYVPTR